jgi:hypothetical protein
VKRVTHNQGKNTPGVDGAIWSTPASRKHNLLLGLFVIFVVPGEVAGVGIITDEKPICRYLLVLLPVAQLVGCTIFAICPNGSEGATRLSR